MTTSDVLDAAHRDPEALAGGRGPVTLDEVQREPALLSAVKRAIYRDRTPGRTGAEEEHHAEDVRRLENEAGHGGLPACLGVVTN